MAATRQPVEGVERELAAVMRRYNARAAAFEQATADRDKAIREAIAARMPRARIIEMTQLSPQRIDQIRRGARL
jgi:hypothetical protein